MRPGLFGAGCPLVVWMVVGLDVLVTMVYVGLHGKAAGVVFATRPRLFRRLWVGHPV